MVITGFGVIFFVVAILLIKTMLFSSQQLNVEKADLAAVDASGASGRLAEAIKLKTISGDDDSELESEPFSGVSHPA